MSNSFSHLPAAASIFCLSTDRSHSAITAVRSSYEAATERANARPESTVFSSECAVKYTGFLKQSCDLFRHFGLPSWLQTGWTWDSVRSYWIIFVGWWYVETKVDVVVQRCPVLLDMTDREGKYLIHPDSTLLIRGGKVLLHPSSGWINMKTSIIQLIQLDVAQLWKRAIFWNIFDIQICSLQHFKTTNKSHANGFRFTTKVPACVKQFYTNFICLDPETNPSKFVFTP